MNKFSIQLLRISPDGRTETHARDYSITDSRIPMDEGGCTLERLVRQDIAGGVGGLLWIYLGVSLLALGGGASSLLEVPP